MQMGTGTGEYSGVTISSGKNFVLDASTFDGVVKGGIITASGTGVISIGPKGSSVRLRLKRMEL